MSSIEFTAENFEENISKSGITLIDFWAGWCAPCLKFAPIFEESSENHPDIQFGKIDTEAETQLSAGANITSIPTLMVFIDGILLFSQPGALSAAGLESLIADARKIDIEAVKRALVK